MAKRKNVDNELKTLIEEHEVVIGLVKNKKKELDLENENKDIQIENEILSTYNNFYSNLNNVDDFFKLNNKLLKKEEKNNEKISKKILKKHTLKEEEEEIILGFTKEQYKEFHLNNKRTQIIGQRDIILSKSMLIYFHSLFENFLSNILVLIYNNSDEQLKDSDIKFSFSELKNFDSIEDAKKHIINHRISNILFSSIDKQLDCIFRLLGINDDNKSSFPIKSLIEISLRRNLFTHEDGVVNDIYIKKCDEYGIENKFQIGEKILFEEDYFDFVYKTYYEFVIKIIFFTWIRLSDNENKYDEAVGRFVNNRAFKMIQNDELSLGLKIIDFLLTPKITKKIDEATYLMIILNKALIYKMKNNPEEVNKILQKIDWSAKSDLYKFANYILNEQWDLAGTLMLKVVRKKDDSTEYLSEFEIKTWPLFFEFKEQEIFKMNFKKIFKKEFILDS